MAFRKELESESNNTVRTFEKRLTNYEAHTVKARHSLSKAEEHCTACKEKANNVKDSNDTLRASSKSVQTLLESLGKIEEAREESAKTRAAAAEKEKENFVAEINRRREIIETKFKESEQQLMVQYKKADTQGFV
mmetsp:Transcript_8220/g.7203  ORF Transcript_8220/g.7203 Transcript_8220/m.7203 type:complete len:135 (-) Transcript_8220:262-666(-)